MSKQNVKIHALITIEARASKLISKSLLDILLTPDLKKDPMKNPNAAPGNLKKVYPSKANIHLFISKNIYPNLQMSNEFNTCILIILYYICHN